MNAYSYQRLSSAEQIKGAGAGRQSDKAAQVCKEKGWTLCPMSLSDLGYSGFTGENLLKGSLGKFIDAANEGKLLPNPVLIIEQFDRFSRRDIDESEPLLINLLKNGVAIHNCFNGKTYTKESTKSIGDRVEILLGFKQAHEYSANLSKRVSDGLQRLKYEPAARGDKVNMGNWQPNWVDFIGPKKGVGIFKLNDKAKTVQRIVSEYLDNNSLSHIAITLNNENIKPIGHGKIWRQAQVLAILKSELLIGHCEIKGQRFEHYFPAVISQDDYNALQLKLKSNGSRKGGGDRVVNLFRNKCYCSECGGHIGSQISHPHGKLHAYYRCFTARQNPKGCKIKRMIHIELVEQDFFGILLQQTPDEILNGSKHNDNAKEINSLKMDIVKLDNTIADTIKLIGTVDIAELQTKLQSLKAEREQKQKTLAELTAQSTAQGNLPESIATLKQMVAGDKVQDYDLALRNMLIRLQDNETRKQLLAVIPSIVERITIDLVWKSYVVEFVNGQQQTRQIV